MSELMFPIILAAKKREAAAPSGMMAEKLPGACGTAKVHNFEFGRMKYTDRLLISKRIVRPSKFLKIFCFDEKILTKGLITFIQVLDQKRDGNGGYVYVSEGGVGHPYVHLHFTSARNQGVNFLVNIYGR